MAIVIKIYNHYINIGVLYYPTYIPCKPKVNVNVEIWCTTKNVNKLLFHFSVNITSHFMTVLMETYIQHQEKTVLILVLVYVLYNGIWLLIMDMETDCQIVKNFHLVSRYLKLP